MKRIAEATCGEHARVVIEIGPGEGALTEQLLTRVDRLVAIELDVGLANALEARFAGAPLTVLHGDALEEEWCCWQPDVVCGNLPYYAATPLLERMARGSFPGVALIQKEVAERLTAQPGTREYGFLTCLIRLYAEVAPLFHVKPGAFRPPPQVDSTVVRLTPSARSAALHLDDFAGFERFLSVCFRQKRKTLRNNLEATYPSANLQAIPETGLRAEQCSLDQLADLYKKLS